jgi:hypothetical protein
MKATEVDQNTSCRCEFGPLWRCDVHGPGAPQVAPRPPAAEVSSVIGTVWQMLWAIPFMVARWLLIGVVFCGWGPRTAGEVREYLS